MMALSAEKYYEGGRVISGIFCESCKVYDRGIGLHHVAGLFSGVSGGVTN